MMDIQIRKQLEQLEYIKDKLEYIEYDEALGCYIEKQDGLPTGVAAWVNGAFYGFEQAAKAQAVPGWVSVEDKLPIDGQDVIAFDAIKHCVFKGGEFLQGYIESDTGHEYEEPVEVTHWMAVETQEPAND